ncbi:MAG: sulfite exporter TauE/SafE family protein [Sulfobacillus sp.]
MDMAVLGIVGLLSGFLLGSVYVSGSIILSLLLFYIPPWLMGTHVPMVDITIIVGFQAVIAALIVLPFRWFDMHWSLLRIILVPAVLASLGGGLWLRIIPTDVIVGLLGAVTLGAVFLTIWPPRFSVFGAHSTSRLLLLAFMGVLVGFFGGTLGLGGGFILVPVLRSYGVSLHHSISNALIAGGLITFVGLIAKLPHHLVPWPIILVVGLSSALGTFLGSYSAQRIPTVWLRYLVLGGMCIASVKIWIGFL